MRHAPTMDATGLRALEDVFRKAHKEKTELILCGVHDQPCSVLARAGLSIKIVQSLDDALDLAQELIKARTTFAGVPTSGPDSPRGRDSNAVNSKMKSNR